MEGYIVVRGDGRILRSLTVAEAVEAMRVAKRQGDRFASCLGDLHHGRPFGETEREAGYVGASEKECVLELERITRRVP